MNGVDWDYYNKKEFDEIDDMYLPARGEGETKASQIVVAVNKLVYKWYNDGDVYDNTHHMVGWWNDLSSYANWLDKYTGATYILDRIVDCKTDAQYEHILKDLSDALLDKDLLALAEKHEKIGSVYDCKGKFRWEERCEDEDEYEEEDEHEECEDEEDEED